MALEIRGFYLYLGTAVLSVSMETALWILLRAEAQLRARATRVAEISWWGVLAATTILAASFLTDQCLQHGFEIGCWRYVFPVIAFAGLFGVRMSRAPQMELLAFFFSCLYLLGAATSTLFGTLL